MACFVTNSIFLLPPRSKAILDAFSNYDPESFASVPPETVRRVAANVAGLNTEDMVKVFEKECPRTSVGSFLLRWIYHCKKAGEESQPGVRRDAMGWWRAREARPRTCSHLIMNHLTMNIWMPFLPPQACL